jgi:replicative DNA helicase
MATTTNSRFAQPLPTNVDAERAILGAIILDNSSYSQAAESLAADDFSLDSHRRIFLRMSELSDTGRPIDFVTLTEELNRHKELQSVGGDVYVSSLTDGLPRVKNIGQYVRIVKDKALLRQLIHVSESTIIQAYQQEAPAEEIIEAAESALFRISDQRLGQGFRSISEIVRKSFGSIDKLFERGQAITGLRTHYDAFDSMTSGLQRADLVIIAARPSMGKTAFAINIAENVATRDNKVVGIFSLEMSAEALVLRMLASQSRVDSQKIRTGFLTREHIQKIVAGFATLVEAPIFIDDTPAISVPEMRAKCRRLHQAKGALDLILVDYLQLATAAKIGFGSRPENRTQEVSAISRGLKTLAKESNCPVIALSQLSRAAESREGGEPKLSDLRESGAIEQDADIVAFIHRPEMYDRNNPDLEGLAKLIVAKQRNGPTGELDLVFLKNFTRFEEKASDSDFPPGGGSNPKFLN